MPTWGEIVNELNRLKDADGQDHFDEVRKKYLSQLRKHTGRGVLLYATNWTQAHTVDDPEMLLLSDADLQGLMETVHGMDTRSLDLILHSPGGSAEAAESIVSYLRAKFDNIRVIVPQAAMSAATMLACAADTIVMGAHSSLGPIDPQIAIRTDTGTRIVPAQTIVYQFYNAQEDLEERPDSFQAWVPLLTQYHPGLLLQCMNATELAEDLVSQWLRTYMFARDPHGEKRATDIADYLSDHENFKSQDRHIDKRKARELGLAIEDLEGDQRFQDLALSVFHSATLTFDGAGVVKIIENHLGKSYIRS